MDVNTYESDLAANRIKIIKPEISSNPDIFVIAIKKWNSNTGEQENDIIENIDIKEYEKRIADLAEQTSRLQKIVNDCKKL
jgi:hypothetical protein